MTTEDPLECPSTVENTSRDISRLDLEVQERCMRPDESKSQVQVGKWATLKYSRLERNRRKREKVDV